MVAALREQGLLSGTEPYVHDVPHSHRSGRRIEPLISLQWFCDMEQLAEPGDRGRASDGSLRFHPERPWTKVYLDWLENIRPWCISRQLWWGHQLPVWYCDECEETLRRARGARPLRAAAARCERDPDVLDTWFSSGAVAVRHARLAGGDAATAGLLPHRRARPRRATSSSSGSPGW